VAHYFTEDNKISILTTVAEGAAAQTTITSDALNMAGFDSACFIVPVGPVTAGAVTTMKLQQSDDDGSSDAYSDVLGTSITIADSDDNKLKYLDVYRPGKQYLKIVIARATQDATVGGIFAVQYNASSLPVTQGTDVAGERHASAAEGTA